MTEQATIDTSWLRSDPTETLNHSRPRTFGELLDAEPMWRRLYQEWLTENYDKALPGFARAEVLRLYETLSDPGHKRSPFDDVLAKQFADSYKDSFYKDFGVLKDALHARIKDAKANSPTKLSDAEATKAVGRVIAQDAVRRSIDAAAGDAPATILAWAQVTAFKNEFYGAVQQAYAGFNLQTWNRHGDQWQQTQDILNSRLNDYQGSEAELRNTVHEGQEMLRKGSKLPDAYQDKLVEHLVAWASAINGIAAGLAEGAELVSLWAQNNAHRLMQEDFDALFPVTGGLFLAARTAVGIGAGVLGFFPQLAPIGAGLTLADTAIEMAFKRAIVAIESRRDKNKIQLAGAKLELSEEFKNSRAGKLYQKKEKAKEYAEQRLGELRRYPADKLKKVIKEKAETYTPSLKKAAEKLEEEQQNLAVAAGMGLDSLKAKLVEINPALRHDPMVENYFNRFKVLIGAKEDEETKKHAKETAAEIKGLLTDFAGMVGIDVPTLSGLLTEAAGDLLKTVAPSLATAVGQALPALGLVVTVGKSINDSFNYLASINKDLVPEDMSAEEQKQLQEFVGRQLTGKHVAFQALNFESVKFLGRNGDRVHLEVAGIEGHMNVTTLRFTPTDRTKTQAVVLNAVKTAHPAGLKSDEGLLRAAWETIVWGDELGEGKTRASVSAAHADGREFHLDLTISAEGKATVTALKLTKHAPSAPPEAPEDEAVLVGPGLVGERLDVGISLNLFTGTN